jgi:tRNA threonylcarbamoyladenosine biosynthesis protein TsaB
MLILAVDTSGTSCGVAVQKDGSLRYEAVAVNKLTHSVNMMPMVEEGLLRCGLDVTNVDLFAAVIGPGSFTGVRIGVSAIKGMAQATGKPCIGIDALEALAHGVTDIHHVICPIRDARAQQVYGAAFLKDERLMEDRVMKLTAYLDAVGSFGDSFLFTGDGVVPFRELIQERLGARAFFAPGHLVDLRAGSAAFLAFAMRDHAHGYHDLAPLYLRAPQAERERLKKEAQHD